MVCSICLLSNRWYQDIRTIKCGHRFHLDCIKKWSSNNYNCPVCRTKILPQKEICHKSLYKYLKNGTPSLKIIHLNAGIEDT